jgi:hypothetical protein
MQWTPAIRVDRGARVMGPNRIPIPPTCAISGGAHPRRCPRLVSRLFELVCDDSSSRTSRWLRAWRSIVLLAGFAWASGCVREPLPCLIDLDEGELVITEIRGPQDSTDTRGQWIELFNATDRALDLAGLRGSIRPLDGSPVDGELTLTFLVREPLPVAAGAYVVLGTLPLDPGRRPELDYSFNDDFRREPPEIEELSGGVVELPPDENADARDLFANAELQLHACDQLVDELLYVELPTMGTLSYGGPPDADDNDDLSRWCADATEPPADGPMTATGRPGSGGEANRPCP